MAMRTSLEEKKRQQTLLIILGVVALAGVIVLYFMVWSKGGKNEIVIGENDLLSTENVDNGAQYTKQQLSSIVLEEKLKKVDLNIDFFNQTILPFLKLHGDLPVKKGETGRLNPFTPY